MLDLRRLRLLRELEARGTIAATAEALSFTAPAVSQQLAKLEAEVGVRLLERVGRSVRLTPAAHRLVEHTEAVLARLEEAEAELNADTGEIRGRLRVTTFQTAALTMLRPALTQLGTRYPRLEFEVHEVEPEIALDRLRLGEVDLALADEYERLRPRHQGLDFEPLCEDPLRVALPATHSLASSPAPIELSELAGAPWAVGLPGSAYADMVVATCSDRGGFHPKVRHHATDLLIILALVQSGHAVALLPDLLGAQDDPAVALREVAGGPLRRTILTVVRESALGRPGLAELRGALREARK